MCKSGHDLVAIILLALLLALVSGFGWVYMTMLAFYHHS